MILGSGYEKYLYSPRAADHLHTLVDTTPSGLDLQFLSGPHLLRCAVDGSNLRRALALSLPIFVVKLER